ncbi:MAG TPA: radical SAM family heme chaperone HemW [Clostridia bacterium]|nr:radical SAM family heme chaperone HemW [Clostridia bacterium]
MNDGIGMYIHIPFCKSKCYYCDFNSYSGMDHLAGSYFNALKTEMRVMSEDLKDSTVKTVFIGGGTPSLVDPAYISGLLEECRRLFNIIPDAEVSMECNPGTLSFGSLRIYRQAGINRLSIGLQAWQDRLLESLGRIHRRQQFVENLEAAYRAEFTNVNADLIFGLPGQTFEDWTETLEAVTNLYREHRLTHLSCYDLQIEEGTVFGDRYESGTLAPAEDELDRKMYRHAVEFLAEMGYRHYELSNFAIPGFECRHNLTYWRAEEYAGFGAGAHSYLDGKRFGNTTGIEDYITAVKRLEAGERGGVHKGSCENGAGDNPEQPDIRPCTALISAGVEAGLHEDLQYIGREESMSEFMILGLRLIKGISSEKFRLRYGTELKEVYGDKLGKLVDAGLLIREETGNIADLPGEYGAESGGIKPDVLYRLSNIGLDLANKVFIEFI